MGEVKEIAASAYGIAAAMGCIATAAIKPVMVMVLVAVVVVVSSVLPRRSGIAAYPVITIALLSGAMVSARGADAAHSAGNVSSGSSPKSCAHVRDNKIAQGH